MIGIRQAAALLGIEVNTVDGCHFRNSFDIGVGLFRGHHSCGASERNLNANPCLGSVFFQLLQHCLHFVQFFGVVVTGLKHHFRIVRYNIGLHATFNNADIDTGFPLFIQQCVNLTTPID